MSRYSRQILGITGDEPPLTADDTHAAVRRALDNWRGGALLRGYGQDVRRGDWSCGDPIGTGRSIACHADRRGLLVHITEGERQAVRAGHIPWRTAEAVLRQIREPAGQAPLFDLAVST